MKITLKNVALAAVAATQLFACQQDNRNLEKKIDDMQKDVAAIKTSLASGAGRPGANAPAQPQPKRPTADPAKTYAVDITGLPFQGPADAKVTIVKGYEYACPYCEKVRPTIDEVMKKYGKDVKVVYKQFVVHPQFATSTALAACAANKQGKFDDMDTALWEKVFKTRAFDKAPPAGADGKVQQCWETADGCPTVVGLAKDIGLNVDKFKADMKGDCQAEIQKEQKELQVVGVSATPGFFINGRNLSGAQPVEAFNALIDEELKKANDRIAAGTPQKDYYKTWVMDKGEKAAEIK